MFPGKWLQTRIRDSRHEYVARPSPPPPLFFIAFRAPLSYVYVRPILRDHVCVRAAAIQISPLGYTSLQTDTRGRDGSRERFCFFDASSSTRRLFEPLLEYIRILRSTLLLIRQLATRNNRYPRLSISMLVRAHGK